MATDPVEMIQDLDHQTPIANDLAGTLTRLAALPPSPEAPYLTVTLDWRPHGEMPGLRPDRRAFGDIATAQREHLGPRGTVFDSVDADLDRIGAYLEGELDPAAQGVAIVACAARGVFEPIPLDVAMETAIVTAPTPALRQLAYAMEDYPRYVVVVADQRDAFLWVIERQTRQRGVEVAGTDYPRKQQQGGWSQRRYQNRADERIEAFAKVVAEETRGLFADQSLEYLILGADDVFAPPFLDALHQSVKDKLIGTVPLAVTASEHQILAVTEPLIARAERHHEIEAVERVREGVGAGGKGVAGGTDTLTALQTGQVMVLVMNDDFTGGGWADYTMPLYGAGDPPAEHPAGGDASNIVPIALEEEFVRLGLQNAAEIEIVRSTVPVGDDEGDPIPRAGERPRAHAAVELDGLGGVGAILRFALDAGQSTADL